MKIYNKIFSIFLVFILILSIFPIRSINAIDEVEDINTKKVIIHFNNSDNFDWSLWVWAEGKEGSEYKFEKKDDFGKVAEINLKSDVKKVGFIVKGPNWEKNVEGDRFIDITSQITHVWLRDKDPEIYLRRPKKLEEESMKIMDFSIDSFREVNLKFNKDVSLVDFEKNYTLTVDNKDLKEKVESIDFVNGSKNNTKQIKIKFKSDLSIEEDIYLKLNLNDTILEAKSRIGRVVTDSKFDEKYYYDGELGAIYSDSKTEFKLWAPTAKSVDLIIFKNNEVYKSYEMVKSDKGVYSYELKGNQLGTIYMYDVHVDGKVNRVVDPYAKAVTINGEKGVVANPIPSIIKNPNSKDMKNPIIYELHVRDYSIDENSGMKNKGKFLALTEEGTKASNGQITGIDYLKSLGVTHIQLLPIYDYGKDSVDETNPTAKFNWGYDPVNYNSVEGSYSSNPYDPFLRIKELQYTVDSLHKNGLGVIMDVVYNHVFDPVRHSFDKIVPGYYLRKDEEGRFLGGTGVGNETASERKMMRKFIIDSTKYWAKTYKLDGFRFDLMGTHDYETMNMVYEELVKINPNIFILGEGWNMNMGIPENIRATQKNANLMPNLAFFSDDIRDTLKGSVFEEKDKGFVNGKLGLEKSIMQNIKGANGLQSYISASQVIQYVEAHDNLTLWDKLEKTNPEDTDLIRLKRHKLATSIVLLSHGTPFIHAGQEFARTKFGDENSYKSSDKINKFDWNRVLKNKNNVDYVRELIKIRKIYDVFNLKEYNNIDKVFTELKEDDGIVAYKLEKDGQIIYIGHNSTNKVKEFPIKNGVYKVLVKNQKALVEGLENINIKEDKIAIEPLSTLVLVRDLQKFESKALENKKNSVDQGKNNKVIKIVKKIDNSLKIEKENILNNPKTGDLNIYEFIRVLVISVCMFLLLRKKINKIKLS